MSKSKIGSGVGPEIGSGVGSDFGSKVGSEILSKVGSETGLGVGSDVRSEFGSECCNWIGSMQIKDPSVGATARLHSQGHAYLHYIANSTLLTYNRL